MLGKKVSQGQIDSFRRDKKRGVIDFRKKRIILPKEFYNPSGPHSLHWRELAEVQKRTHVNGLMYATYLGGFNGLLNSLLKELAGQGLMSEGSPCRGDYYLVNCGGGIIVDIPGDKPGPWGTQYHEVTYYPRVREDAEEYVKHFCSEALYPVYVAQILSAPSREWDLSREKDIAVS